MMVLTQTAINYAEAMYEAGFTKEQLEEVRNAFSNCELLGRLLAVPVIPKRKNMLLLTRYLRAKLQIL